ncbi:hypothetical protein [Chryseobacterium indoltheticum]|uniref:hypothetical protein n=1 Tax=Chryseobacterium indoltheticum TaxID=254 RepID=UPI0019147BC3|nr:hypothetical protein [Chryseobacterium indoltheticum]QQQ26916.1 hypothetical protein JJL46_12375 [Chryseobacterium indoltheticum]
MDNLKLNNISADKVFFFLLKIWIFTNLISAFLFVAINNYGVNGFINYTIFFGKDFWQAVFLVICFGLLYSIPAMIILGLIIKLWTKNKVILILISIVLVIGTFYLTGSIALKKPKIYIPSPSAIYSIVITFFILTVKIKKKMPINTKYKDL